MFADIVWRFLILETFVLGALRNCGYDHPQKQFCTSEFVLKVKFHKEITLPGWIMEIKKVFKGNVREFNITKSRYVYVQMRTEHRPLEGKKYYMFVRKNNGSIFDMCTPWVIETQLFKRGVAKFYKKGCDCIKEIPKYTVDQRCHWHYSFLLRRGGICSWVETSYFQICEKALLGKSPSE